MTTTHLPFMRITPVRYVATELDKAPNRALSVSELASRYRHPVPADVTRARDNYNRSSPETWFMEEAIRLLGDQVSVDDGVVCLVKPFDELRYEGEPLHRLVKEAPKSDEVTMQDVKAIRAKASQLVFSVSVQGGRGAVKEQKLKLHPLAAEFPGMDDNAFLSFVADVKANGVNDALLVWGDQVLDGRHRLLAAYHLGLPVRVEYFTGSDTEALSRVWSANVERRHLSVAQSGLLVREWFLPKAVEEAAQRQSVLNGKTQPDLLPPNLAEANGEAPAIAVKRAGACISAATVRTMAPVDHAPKTKQRIRNGEIKTATAARKAAQEETGDQTPAPKPIEPQSNYRQLGRIITAAQGILNGATGTSDKARTTDDDIRARCDEVETIVKAALEKVRGELSNT